MRYIIDVDIEGANKRTYNVTADTPEEAKEKLLLRLPPNQRQNVNILSLKPDPKEFIDDDAFGMFNN
jgi:hypothetical protein